MAMKVAMAMEVATVTVCCAGRGHGGPGLKVSQSMSNKKNNLALQITDEVTYVRIHELCEERVRHEGLEPAPHGGHLGKD